MHPVEIEEEWIIETRGTQSSKEWEPWMIFRSSNPSHGTARTNRPFAPRTLESCIIMYKSYWDTGNELYSALSKRRQIYNDRFRNIITGEVIPTDIL